MTDNQPHESNRAPSSHAAARPLATLLRVAIPLGILAAGYVGFSFLAVEVEEEKEDPVADQVLRTRVDDIHFGDYPVVVRTNGIVQAHNEVTLSAEVSGQIKYVSPNFEAGAYFEEGERLIELDSGDYKNAVAVAEATKLGAEAALQLAKQDFERNRELRAKNVSSEAELQLALAARLQAEAALDTAIAELDRAQRNLERTTIYAPFAGRVRHREVGPGQAVSPGTPLGGIFSIDYAEVRLPIASHELQVLTLPEMANDPPVEIELRDSLNESSDVVWKANIVRTEGALDQDSLELFAIARVDDPFGIESGKAPLRIGQPVRGFIPGKTLCGVVAVPRIAIRQLDQIYLVDKVDLTLQPKTIKPLWSDEDYVIVPAADLDDDHWLSTTRLVYAPAGSKVEIIPDLDMKVAAEQGLSSDEGEPVNN